MMGGGVIFSAYNAYNISKKKYKNKQQGLNDTNGHRL